MNQPSPEIEALQQTVLELTSGIISWRARAIELQRRVEALERPVDDRPMRVVGGAAE